MPVGYHIKKKNKENRTKCYYDANDGQNEVRGRSGQTSYSFLIRQEALHDSGGKGAQPLSDSSHRYHFAVL